MPSRIPPVISENEALQTPTCEMRSFSPLSEIGNFAPKVNGAGLRPRPSSLCEPLEGGFDARPARPTSLFKGSAGRQQRLIRQQFPVAAATRGATVLSPTASYSSEGGGSHHHLGTFKVEEYKVKFTYYIINSNNDNK